MIAKTVHYKGFDGKDVEEVVRLNLTKAEIMNLNMNCLLYTSPSPRDRG